MLINRWIFYQENNKNVFVVSYKTEKSIDQSKKVNLKDLISKENFEKLVKSMKYETETSG